MGGAGAVAHEDSHEGDDICEHIWEEMEGIGEDGDWIGVVSSCQLDGHKDHGDYGDLF